MFSRIKHFVRCAGTSLYEPARELDQPFLYHGYKKLLALDMSAQRMRMQSWKIPYANSGLRLFVTWSIHREVMKKYYFGQWYIFYLYLAKKY